VACETKSTCKADIETKDFYDFITIFDGLCKICLVRSEKP